MLIQFVVIFITTILMLISNHTNEINNLCTLLIIFLFVLFGCTLYKQKQFIDVKKRFNNNVQEYELNQKIYESTIKFYYFYTNQQQFKIIKWIYLYISFNILLINQNFILIKYQDSHIQNDNIEISQSEYLLNIINIIIEEPMLSVLFILSSIIAFIFIILELLKLFFFIFLIYQERSIPIYYYKHYNIKISKTVTKAQIFCQISIFNNLSKSIALIIFLNFTENQTSYLLIGSSIFYHLIMIIFQIKLFQQINHFASIYQNVNDIKSIKDQNLCFDDHFMFIDSILKIKNFLNKLFQFFLIICVILTINGSIFYDRKLINKFSYDGFIYFECGLFQLVILTLLIIEYILKPFCFNLNFQECLQNQTQVFQDQEFIQIVPKSIEKSLQQIPLKTDHFTTNQRMNIQRNNSFNQLSFVSLTNIKNYFIYNVDLQNKIVDCTICLEQMTDNQLEIVQLKCHNTHIFHEKCIRDWLSQNKNCPLCNTKFMIQ
ncbi:unnamed protein product [Paramecium pentaurelia]|uniref:RING-type domain-containing protein n=1 Tax=Paramecium pentaurelia TaxID=43138 RepID=A0A8S1X666_9CILI|nr:unnamed protein product [Paramecium pentaurelia]